MLRILNTLMNIPGNLFIIVFHSRLVKGFMAKELVFWHFLLFTVLTAKKLPARLRMEKLSLTQTAQVF